MFWKTFYADDIQPEIQVAPQGCEVYSKIIPLFETTLMCAHLNEEKANITQTLLQGGGWEKKRVQRARGSNPGPAAC